MSGDESESIALGSWRVTAACPETDVRPIVPPVPIPRLTWSQVVRQSVDQGGSDHTPDRSSTGQPTYRWSKRAVPGGTGAPVARRAPGQYRPPHERIEASAYYSGQKAQAAADEVFTSQNDNTTPEWVVARRQMLWGGLAPNVRERLHVDGTSLYSVTDDEAADRMSKIISHWVGVDAVVTDATACVGGNTASFARTFKHVNAVELSPVRSDMLLHNMSVLGLTDRVTVYKGDYLLEREHMVQDVVFIDPPWGGPEYKRIRRLNMYLSTMNVGDLVVDLLRYRDVGCALLRPHARLVALKAPLNFNVHGLQESMRNNGYDPEKCIHVTPIGKVLFILAHSPRFEVPALPPGLVTTHAPALTVPRGT